MALAAMPSHPETGNPEKPYYIVTSLLNEVVKDQAIYEQDLIFIVK